MAMFNRITTHVEYLHDVRRCFGAQLQPLLFNFSEIVSCSLLSLSFVLFKMKSSLFLSADEALLQPFAYFIKLIATSGIFKQNFQQLQSAHRKLPARQIKECTLFHKMLPEKCRGKKSFYCIQTHNNV